VRTARKLCTHNLAPRHRQAGEVRALSSWPPFAARSSPTCLEGGGVMWWLFALFYLAREALLIAEYGRRTS